MAEKRAKKAHVFPVAEDHWYVEGPSNTNALLRVERFGGLIWDPSCGQGNIVAACHAAGLGAIGSDIVDRGSPGFQGQANFLEIETQDFFADNIICNPPYGRGLLIEAFIRHALSAPTLQKLAVFAEVRFLMSEARMKGLYADAPPQRVYLIAPRPSCPPGVYLEAGNKAQGGTPDFCWLVWDRTHPAGPTTLHWMKRLKEEDR